MYKVPSFLISNVIKEEIALENIIEGYSKKEKIIDVYSIKNFDERSMVYFFTKKGMIKKTSLNEYDINYSLCQAYKLKYENDEVISVCIEENDGEILIVTKKGMAIRFLSEGVNTMGRIASGVTGISLKEDDEAISGSVICTIKNDMDEIAIDDNNIDKEIILVTKNKDKKIIEVNNIRIQNRAGRGTNIMVINLDDEIAEVQYS